METTLRRLFVGGIGSSVTDAELAERFGRFGKVDEVEIISRKDEQGNPIKTFAYMNINISDAELKKCLSVLNKSKWKGGVLQIELAKESFLHKLELERQAAKEKKQLKEQSHPQDDLLQSLEKAGVTDFQMKAAVPGTEVPNHKNWVVSKYGRVLPVLHLKEEKKNKMMKYDPSKYCHNLKKLDSVSVESRPVSELTWHLDGGDDDISKKRRGEFPEFKSAVKKSKVNSSVNTSRTAKKEKSITTPQTSPQVAEDALGSQHRGDTFLDKSWGYMGNKGLNSMSSEEYDSGEEFKTILDKKKMGNESGRQAEDFNIEVVDDSFTPSYQTHWEIGKHCASKSNAKDDNDYDSADTDEIIAVAKTTQNCDRSKKEKPNTPLKQNGNVVSKNQKNSKCNVKRDDISTEEDRPSNESDTENSSDSYSDEEYESMMQNCYRLDLSIGDLEALVKRADETEGENNDSDQEYDSSDTEGAQPKTVGELKGSERKQTEKIQTSKSAHARDLKPGKSRNVQSSESNSSEGESGSMKQIEKLKSVKKTNSKSSNKMNSANEGENAAKKTQKEAKNNTAAVAGTLKRRKGIEPEDIVASLLEDDDDDDSSNDQPKLKKRKNPQSTINKPPAFKGLGSLMSSLCVSETKAPQSSRSCERPTTVVAVCDQTEANSSSSENKVKGDSKDNDIRSKPVKKILPNVHQTREDGGGSGSSSSSSSSSISSDEESSSSTSSDTKPKVVQMSSSKEQSNSRVKQLQDNQKRLAAMEERRKEREQQKQTIQGALLKLDSQSEKKTHHIVFSSESEEESEKEEEASTSHVNSNKQANQVKAKLFDSSGEDSDDEEEKDDERFEIKKQYEGRSGEKLMQLQSRFGTDERFKMDARFLEDESEDEEDTEESQNIQADDDGLLAEKKKNLDILQNVLNINVEPRITGKKETKAKKFKDPNALLYDPTKEDHEVFEMKEKKESKSEKKKKRLEAEKLPEVSKDTFHEVTADFKEVFGAQKPQETTWDQREEPQKKEVESSVSNVELSFQKTDLPGGFTFSFFGTSTEESISQDEPYKIENIKSAKVAWQEDPRFQDSSSEEEEEEEKDTTVTSVSSSSQNSSNIRFFFFVKDEARLKEGPKMFLRSSKSEQKAKDWDDMKDTLIEKCKKRHREAKRKLKSGH